MSDLERGAGVLGVMVLIAFVASAMTLLTFGLFLAQRQPLNITRLRIKELALETPLPVLKRMLRVVRRAAGVASYSADRRLGELRIVHGEGLDLRDLTLQLRQAGFHTAPHRGNQRRLVRRFRSWG